MPWRGSITIFQKKYPRVISFWRGITLDVDQAENTLQYALSHSGISAVLAPSFARIFYRNCVDGGYLLPLEIETSTLEQISDNDMLEIDIEKNQIHDITNGKNFSISPFPPLIKKIIDSGGLMYYKE